MQIDRSRFIFTLLAGLLVVAPAVYAKKDKHIQQPVISLQGKVASYLINPFGEIDGLILDNGTLAKTPPHMSSNVTELVKPGDSVTLQGTPEAGASFETY